jgi:methionyl-tRNA formyltransferase
VHESALPQGKGWAPLFWQILEGKNSIPIVLFEATNYVDAGDIYLTDTIELDGDELYAEIRQKQAEKTVQMCLTFLGQGVMLKPLKQTGIESFYNKRTPKDSELNTAQPLEQLFNQLRIASNEDHPAFFYRNGVKYIIKISKESVKGV